MEILFAKIVGRITLFDILLSAAGLLAILNWIFPRYGAVLAALSYAAFHVQQLIIDHSQANILNVAAGVCLAYGFCKFWERPFPDLIRWMAFLLMLGLFMVLDFFWQKVF